MKENENQPLLEEIDICEKQHTNGTSASTTQSPPLIKPNYEQVNYVYPSVSINIQDPEALKNFNFNEQSIRKGFIRKVYLILMGQLLLTFGIVALFVFNEPTKLWAHNNPWLLFVAIIALMITMICMACCENLHRKTPTNFIFLGILTLAESFLLGVASSVYAPDAVLIAVGMTAAVCLTLTIFAFQTKWDFTILGGVLLAATIIFVIFGIAFVFMPSKLLELIYASIGVVIFSIFLIIDTQMMMDGGHKYTISPEEYIFAALNLYLDIINIFLYILMIVSSGSDNRN